MINPFALHFYSGYGPALNFLQEWPATAWLTKFYLPHFSETSNPILNSLHGLSWVFIFAGLLLFLAGAIPIYWAKFQRRGAVVTGLYRSVRHPQYVGLAVVGIGTLLLWPRFLVLVTFVAMIGLYMRLARWEESNVWHVLARATALIKRRPGGFYR